MPAEREQRAEQRPVDVEVRGGVRTCQSLPAGPRPTAGAAAARGRAMRARPAVCGRQVGGSTRHRSVSDGTGACPARRQHRQRPAFLLGEIGLDDVLGDRRGEEPCSPCSAKIDAGDLRVVARREEHEPAVVAQVLAALPRRARRPWFEITCAVPVLPATSRPAIRRAPPVPAPFTTIHRPSCIAASVSGLNADAVDRRRRRGTGFQPVRPRPSPSRRCGVTRVPPLATRGHHAPPSTPA